LLLCAAITGLLVWALSILVPAAWEQWASWNFDRQNHSTQPAPGTITPPGQVEPSQPPPVQPAPEPPGPAENELVGRLSIPRLRLTAMVREGDSEGTLSLALGHIPGTAFPWQSGNVGVAGHRDRIFRGLREIRKDDLIRFETSKGAYVYKVDETKIVKPTEVSVLAATPAPELTLVTCYPFYYVGSANPQSVLIANR
jgi:sortase A